MSACGIAEILGVHLVLSMPADDASDGLVRAHLVFFLFCFLVLSMPADDASDGLVRAHLVFFLFVFWYSLCLRTTRAMASCEHT